MFILLAYVGHVGYNHIQRNNNTYIHMNNYTYIIVQRQNGLWADIDS